MISGLLAKLCRLPVGLATTLLLISSLGYELFGTLTQLMAIATLAVLPFQLGLADQTLKAKLQLDEHIGVGVNAWFVAYEVAKTHFSLRWSTWIIVVGGLVALTWVFSIVAALLVVALSIGQWLATYISAAARADKKYTISIVPEVVLWPITALSGLGISLTFSSGASILGGVLISATFFNALTLLLLAVYLRGRGEDERFWRREIPADVFSSNYRERAILLFKKARLELAIVLVPPGVPELAGHLRVAFQFFNVLTMPREMMNLKMAEYVAGAGKSIDIALIRRETLIAQGLFVLLLLAIVTALVCLPDSLVSRFQFNDIWIYLSAVAVAAVIENGDGINTRLLILVGAGRAQFNSLCFAMILFFIVFLAVYLMFDSYAFGCFAGIVASSLLRNITHAKIIDRLVRDGEAIYASKKL